MGKEGLFSTKKKSKPSNEIDENYDEETSSVVLSSPARSTQSTSSSFIYSSARNIRTPGRKLFKKLFACKTPDSKKLRGAAHDIYSVASSDYDLSIPGSSSPVTETSTTESNRVVPPSPPHVTRKLYNNSEDHNNSTTMLGLKSAMMKGSPVMRGMPVPNQEQAEDATNVPLPESPSVSRTSSVRSISCSTPSGIETLLKTNTSTDTMMEDMLLPDTTSSSYSENSPDPQQDDAPTKQTMRPAGMAIPTPQVSRTHIQDEDQPRILFPHPLRSVTESPNIEASHLHLSESADETPPNNSNGSGGKTFTWEEVQKYVREAEKSLRDHLEDQHQHSMEEFREEAEKALAEHGTQWKRDADAEYQRMNNLLKEEKSKTESKHRDLLVHNLKMSEVQQQLGIEKMEKKDLLFKIKTLAAKLSQNEQERKLNEDQLNEEIQVHQEELKTLRDQASADKIKSQYEEELKKIQKDKDAAEHKVTELVQLTRTMEEQLQVLKQHFQDAAKANNNAQAMERHQQELRQLQESKNEANQQVHALQELVNDLRQQVNSSNMEELITMKAEKAAAERQINDLQEQLDSRMEGHQNAQIQLRDAKDEISTFQKQLKASSKSAQAQLQEARTEISALQSQLEANANAVRDQLNMSGFSDVPQHEELFSAKAEVETLKVLREEEKRGLQHKLKVLKEERDDLKSTLKRVEQQYQIELSSPRKKGRESTLEIHALTIEMETPKRGDKEVSGSDDLNKRLKAMAQNFEKLQEERNVLQSQLQDLQEKQGKELEIAVQQAQQVLQTQLQTMKSKMEQQEKDFEGSNQSTQASFTVEEIKELTAEVEELKKQHAEEMKKHMESGIVDLEKARDTEEQRTKKLLAGFEVEKKILTENHQQETSALKSQLDESKQQQAQHQEELGTIQAKSKAEIEALREKLEFMSQEHSNKVASIHQRGSDELEQELQLLQARIDMERITHEKEKFELIKAGEKECDELREKLVEMKEEMAIKIEEAKQQTRMDSEKKAEGVKAQLEKLRADSEARTHTITEQYIKEMQAKFDEQMDDAKVKAKGELDKVHMSLDEVEKEKYELSSEYSDLKSKLRDMERQHKIELEQTRASAQEEMERELKSLEDTMRSMEIGDSALSQTVAELQTKTETDRKEYNDRLQKLKAEHNKEIEEFLGQLDLVEAESNERYAKAMKTIEEKDAVVSALGVQLAEAQARLGATGERQETLAKDLELLQEQLNNAKGEIESKNLEIEELIARHQKAMAEETFFRERMVEEAREEMIEQAEIKYEQANAEFKKLRRAFDNANAKIAALERDLHHAKKETDEIRKMQEERDVELADELAQAKAGK